MDKIKERIMKEYWMLYTDWVPSDKGRMKKEIDKNKKALLSSALDRYVRKIGEASLKSWMKKRLSTKSKSTESPDSA